MKSGGLAQSFAILQANVARLLATISDRAMISGGSMSEREVETIVDILNVGALPYPVQLLNEKQLAAEK